MKNLRTSVAVVLSSALMLVQGHALAATVYADYGSTEHSAAIDYVKSSGIMKGYPDGSFKGHQTINRAEFAKVISIVDSPSLQNRYSTVLPFHDTSNSAWYAPYIVHVYGYGLMTGYPDSTFRPEAGISFTEAAKVISLAYDIGQLDGEVWYRGYVNALAQRNAIPTTIRSFHQVLTRGEVAEILYRIGAGVTGLPSQTYASLGGDTPPVVVPHDDDDDGMPSTPVVIDCDDYDDRLVVTIEEDMQDVQPGDEAMFDITVHNCTDDDQEIDLIAHLDADYEFSDASDDGDDEADDRIEWDGIDVDEDDSETVSLTLEIDDDADDGDELELRVTAEGEDDETASVTHILYVGDEDDDEDDDEDEDEDCEEGDDDIAVMIDVDEDEPEAGDTVEFEITVHNCSDEDRDIDIRADLDRDFTFVSASDGGIHEQEDRVNWRNIQVDEDEEETVKLRVRIDSSADEGDELELEVTAEDDDDNEDDASETIEVSDDNGDDDDDDNDDDNDDLSVNVEADDTSVEEDDIVVYDIEVENDTGRDQSVTVHGQFDEDFIFTSGSDNVQIVNDRSVRWNSFFIQDGQTKTFTLRLRVRSNVDEDEDLDLFVRVEDQNGHTDTFTETVTVEEEDDDDDDDDNGDDEVSVRIRPNVEDPEVGEIIRYVITIDNDGNEDVRVDLEAEFDEDLVYVTSTDDGDDTSDRRVEWQDILVREDQSETVTLDLRVRSGADDGDILEVEVTADTGDDEDTDSVTVEVND